MRRLSPPGRPASPPRPLGAKSARRRSRWWRVAARAGAAVLVTGMIAAGPAWLWVSGWLPQRLDMTHRALLALSVEAGLTVQDVLVEGRRETPTEYLLAAVKLQRGAPIFGFDPETTRKRIEALTWVRQATVERHLPGTVYVRLVERVPLALWQHQGRFSVIDEEGAVITDENTERYASLPVVVGEDAPKHARALLATLSREPEMLKRVRAAVRVGGRRWTVRLDNNVDVLLPEEATEAAWSRLADLDRRHRLLDRDVIVIDLRLPDRLVVRTTEDVAKQARRQPGKDA